MIEGLSIGLVIGIVIAALFIPFRLPERKKPKKPKKRYLSTFGSVLGSINEIYLPSAHKAGQIVEEMKIARTAIPGAPDPFDKNKPSVK